MKKKIQNELEQTKKSDEKQLPRLHQQINEKRNELNRIDQQLTQIIQENPLEKLEKSLIESLLSILHFHFRLELKIRDYIRLLNDLPSRFHSLNVMHLSLSNDLRSNILTWPIEEFSRLNLIEHSIESSPTPLISIPTQTPTTPLTSLKQLLGIRTQDTTILEPILTTKEDYQRLFIDPLQENHSLFVLVGIMKRMTMKSHRLNIHQYRWSIGIFSHVLINKWKKHSNNPNKILFNMINSFKILSKK